MGTFVSAASAWCRTSVQKEPFVCTKSAGLLSARMDIISNSRGRAEIAPVFRRRCCKVYSAAATAAAAAAAATADADDDDVSAVSAATVAAIR